MRPTFIKHMSEVTAEGYERKPDGIAGVLRDLGAATGSQSLGVSLTTIRPGKKSSHYHHHKTKEEFFYVIEGRCRIRVNGDIHDLNPGDAVSRPAGSLAAHQFFNPYPKPCDVLMIGVMTGKGLSDHIALPELESGVQVDASGRRKLVRARPKPAAKAKKAKTKAKKR